MFYLAGRFSYQTGSYLGWVSCDRQSLCSGLFALASCYWYHPHCSSSISMRSIILENPQYMLAYCWFGEVRKFAILPSLSHVAILSQRELYCNASSKLLCYILSFIKVKPGLCRMLKVQGTAVETFDSYGTEFEGTNWSVCIWSQVYHLGVFQPVQNSPENI